MSPVETTSSSSVEKQVATDDEEEEDDGKNEEVKKNKTLEEVNCWFIAVIIVSVVDVNALAINVVIDVEIWNICTKI